jgi:hypothetical protein
VLRHCVFDQDEGCSPKGLVSLDTLRFFLSGSFDVVSFQDADEMNSEEYAHDEMGDKKLPVKDDIVLTISDKYAQRER